MSTLAFAMDQRARHSQLSRNPFHAGHGFRGYTGSQLLRPVRLLAPLYGSTGLPANGGFYFQAFDGSVTLPVAGYDYNSVWTPLLAGLPPAGMAASLAALVRPCSCPASERSWQGTPKTRSTSCPSRSICELPLLASISVKTPSTLSVRTRAGRLSCGKSGR